ncbi:MAG: putative acyltransferase [Cyclobacteriaceae bacterium]|jgi:predicted acyltransferase
MENRYKPLDIFRGLTIAFMIVVNTPGDWGNTYSLLLHADWHGFTPTDLVFPSFLFAVGNAIAFVAKKWDDQSNGAVLSKGLQRAFFIFLVGYLLHWVPFFRPVDGQWVFKAFETTRIFGVLQRIGFCYALALPLIYFLTIRQLLWSGAGLLLAYWALMTGFGDLTLTGNAALKLDLWTLGANHLYTGEGIPFDPEGLLSSLPAVVNIIGGFLVGHYIRVQKVGFEQLSKLLLVGLLLMALSYLWHPLFPVNKKIWSSSFVLLTIGLDCLILGALIYLMELTPRKLHFNIFRTFGVNPLFIYVLAGLLTKAMLLIRIDGVRMYSWVYQNLYGWIGGKLGSFAFALSVTTICYFAARWLEKRNIYIKI